mgnify:CR=1 FL=1
MAKYKVAVISILLNNNTLADYGTIVEDDQLNNPDELLKGSYITKATKQDIQDAKKKAEGSSFVEDEGEDYSVWTKALLNAELDKREIEHDANSTNEVLAKLLADDDNK